MVVTVVSSVVSLVSLVEQPGHRAAEAQQLIGESGERRSAARDADPARRLASWLLPGPPPSVMPSALHTSSWVASPST